MKKIIERYCRAIEHALVALLAVMVLLVFGNVVLRYVFNSGLAVSEEMARWAFVWVVFLGAIVAIKERTHLGSDLFFNLLSSRGKRICFVVGRGLMLWISGLLLLGSWRQVAINWDVAAPTSGWSMGVFYGCGVVFAASAMVLLGRDVLGALTGRLTFESNESAKQEEMGEA